MTLNVVGYAGPRLVGLGPLGAVLSVSMVELEMLPEWAGRRLEQPSEADEGPDRSVSTAAPERDAEATDAVAPGSSRVRRVLLLLVLLLVAVGAGMAVGWAFVNDPDERSIAPTPVDTIATADASPS